MAYHTELTLVALESLIYSAPFTLATCSILWGMLLKEVRLSRITGLLICMTFAERAAAMEL